MQRAEILLKVGAAFWLTLFGLIGCGPKLPNAPEPPLARIQLNAIARAYLDACDNYDRAPVNKEELLPFLKNIKNPEQPATEDDLKSATDGQDFVIHWGFDIRRENLSGDPSKLPVLAYERVGKDGKKLVSQIREVRQLTDEQLAELPFPQGYRHP